MKNNIIQPLLDWDARSVAILAMAKLRVKSTISDEQVNERTPLSLDYVQNTTEETAESTA
jgi:hypothetical protein